MELKEARQVLTDAGLPSHASMLFGEAWEIEIDLEKISKENHEAEAIDLVQRIDGKLIANFKRLKNCPSSLCLIKTVEITDASPEGLKSYLESL